jgi:hypothetical protein
MFDLNIFGPDLTFSEDLPILYSYWGGLFGFSAVFFLLKISDCNWATFICLE